MPDGTDVLHYEAFLVQPDRTAHWVVAIVGHPARTKARRFARLGDATGAARLADALNSRLLCRPNHRARLRAALDGLPLPVHAAVRHIPTGDAESTGLLAELLPGDPIDGLLLFGSTSTITPRTAHALAFAAEDAGDLCHDAANADQHRFQLPVLIRRQRPEQLLRAATDLDELAAALRDGLPPETSAPAARLAVRVAVEHAERLHEDDPANFAEGSQLLPTSSHDYDFAAIRRDLLDDTSQPRVSRISLRTT